MSDSIDKWTHKRQHNLALLDASNNKRDKQAAAKPLSITITLMPLMLIRKSAQHQLTSHLGTTV